MRWMVGLLLGVAVVTGHAQQPPQQQQPGQPQPDQQQAPQQQQQAQPQEELITSMEMRELARSVTHMRDILRDLSFQMDREEMARERPATEIAELLTELGDTLHDMARRIEQGSAPPAEREDINQRLTEARQQLLELDRHRVGP
ncbi:hypothetical protein HUS23_03480 [Ectothiorhodospiraceae bacterium 2226]|nr:hypothetical protein HUS23_03480 [Ectothiorhodospiraceae bacterium 2226]